MSQKDVYNTIVVSTPARGKCINGYIDGTPKPGTVLQLKAAVEPINGLFTWEVYNRDADGDRPRALSILREDYLQGRSLDTAYVSGTIGMLYIPLPGDELLMLLLDVSGTGDTRAIGDLYMPDDATGKLVVTTGTPEVEPFVLLETLAAPTADVLAHMMFTGF